MNKRMYTVIGMADLFVKSYKGISPLYEEISMSELQKSIAALEQSDIKSQLYYESRYCNKLMVIVIKELTNVQFMIDVLSKAEKNDVKAICKITDKLKDKILIINKDIYDIIAHLDSAIYYIDKNKKPYKSTVLMMCELEDGQKKDICQQYIDKRTPEITKLDYIRRLCITLGRQLETVNKVNIDTIAKYNALKDLL